MWEVGSGERRQRLYTCICNHTVLRSSQQLGGSRCHSPSDGDSGEAIRGSIHMHMHMLMLSFGAAVHTHVLLRLASHKRDTLTHTAVLYAACAWEHTCMHAGMQQVTCTARAHARTPPSSRPRARTSA